MTVCEEHFKNHPKQVYTFTATRNKPYSPEQGQQEWPAICHAYFIPLTSLTQKETQRGRSVARFTDFLPTKIALKKVARIQVDSCDFFKVYTSTECWRI